MGVQRNSLEFVRVQRSSYYESYAYSVVHESSCHEHSDQDNVNLIECIGIWWWSPFPLAALWVMSILEFMKVHDMNIWPIQWHRMRKRFCITFSPGSIPLFCRRPACFTLTHCCFWEESWEGLEEPSKQRARGSSFVSKAVRPLVQPPLGLPPSPQGRCSG